MLMFSWAVMGLFSLGITALVSVSPPLVFSVFLDAFIFVVTEVQKSEYVKGSALS
jgi:hypothetical protein